MNVKMFVTGSAAVLAVWLGVTFVKPVPAGSYRPLGKGSVPISAGVEKAGGVEVPEVWVEGKAAVAVSR